MTAAQAERGAPRRPDTARRVGRPAGVTAPVWVIAAGCVVLPATFVPVWADAFARPKLIALAAIVLVAAATTIGLWRRGLAVGPPRSAAGVAVGGFVALNLAAYLLSVDRSQSLFGERLQYQGLAAVVLYAVSFWVCAAAVRDERTLGLVLRAAAVGGTAVAGYAILQRIGLDPAWDVLPGGRVFSSVGQPNALAGYLVLVIPVTAAVAVLDRRYRRLWVVGAGAQVVALALTQSRGGYLGLAVGGLVGAGLVTRRFDIDRRRVAGVALGLVAFAGAMALVSPVRDAASEVLDDKVLRSDIGGSESVRLHIDLWNVAVHMSLDNPAFGTGQETYPELFPAYRDDVLAPDRIEAVSPYRPESPHNVYLAIAAGAGLPALGSYLTLLAVAAVVTIRALTPSRRGRSLALIAILAAGAGHLVTDFFVTAELSGSWLFWVLIGAATGVVATDGRARQASGAAAAA